MYLYENLDGHVPIAQTLDAASTPRVPDRIKMRASDSRLTVPGHDRASLAHCPSNRDGSVAIC